MWNLHLVIYVQERWIILFNRVWGTIYYILQEVL